MPDSPDLKTFEIRVSGKLPGEDVIAKIIDWNMKYRDTMDPEIRKRWDAILVEQAEDLQAIWRNLWVQWGLLRPKP